jgi:hypothetical protein
MIHIFSPAVCLFMTLLKGKGPAASQAHRPICRQAQNLLLSPVAKLSVGHCCNLSVRFSALLALKGAELRAFVYST